MEKKLIEETIEYIQKLKNEILIKQEKLNKLINKYQELSSNYEDDYD